MEDKERKQNHERLLWMAKIDADLIYEAENQRLSEVQKRKLNRIPSQLKKDDLIEKKGKKKRMIWKYVWSGVAAAVILSVGAGSIVQIINHHNAVTPIELDRTREEETQSIEKSQNTEEIESVEEVKNKEKEQNTESHDTGLIQENIIKDTETNETVHSKPYLTEAAYIVTAVLEDGERYDFMSDKILLYSYTDTYTGSYHIIKRSRKNGEETILAEMEGISYKVVVDDGILYFGETQDEMFRVYSIDLNGEGKTKLVMETEVTGEGIYGELPDYDINGICEDYLVYSDGTWSGNQIYSYNMNSKETAVLSVPGMIVEGSFKDAPYLILRGFTSDVSPSELVYISADGKQENKLTDYGMGFAADGMIIYYIDGGRWNEEKNGRESYDMVAYDVSKGDVIFTQKIEGGLGYFMNANIPVWANSTWDTSIIKNMRTNEMMEAEMPPSKYYFDDYFEYQGNLYGIAAASIYYLNFEEEEIVKICDYTDRPVTYIESVQVEEDMLLVRYLEEKGGREYKIIEWNLSGLE